MEKRGTVRKNFVAEISFTFQGGKKILFHGEVSDLSSTGMGLTSECSLRPGQVIHIKGGFPGHTGKSAKVMWVIRFPDSLTKAGLLFI